MNITRHNYEEFFLLYVDNELSIVQRKAVEAFVEENPDLRPELVMLQQSILPADEPVMFMDKASLLRTSSAPNPVNDTNCEEYFILYADDELTNEQKDQVEQFVYRTPQHQASFELFQQVRLMPESAVVFPDKYALYRSEEEDKAPVVRMRWWKIAAAAAILLLIGGTTWYTMTKGGDKVQPGANGEFAHTGTNEKPKANQSTPAIKEQTQQDIAAVTPDKATAPDQATAPATDLTTNNKDKKKDQPALVVPSLVKDKQTEDLATNNKKERKNIESPRNIQEVPNVPQEEKNVPITDPDKEKTNKALASTTIGGTKKYDTEVTGLPPTRIESKISEDMAVNNPKKFEPTDDDLYPVDSDNKKNRMRGFFRKVSRVFDKATNADTDNGKSSIRIASFEFALK